MLPRVIVSTDRMDVALSPEHMSRPPPEAPPCAPPCAPPITPPSPGPGAPGWDRKVVCIQPSRSTSTPENSEHQPEEPQNVSSTCRQTQPLNESITRLVGHFFSWNLVRHPPTNEILCLNVFSLHVSVLPEHHFSLL